MKKLNEVVRVEPSPTGVKMVILINGEKTVEIELSHSEARRLARMLTAHAEAGRLQINALLKKMAELERALVNLEERLRALEKKG